MVDAADRTLADDVLAEEAIELARQLLAAAEAGEARPERRRRQRLGRLLAHPDGRDLVVDLTDRVLRIERRRAAARTFSRLVRRGAAALGPLDALQARAGAVLAPVVPGLVMPLVERRIRAETRGLVIPADDPALARHIATRSAQGFALNINPLGEAVLSDAEAGHRLAVLLATIGRDDVSYVSAKISALVANLDVLAFEHSLQRICAALRTVFRAAGMHTFVNLDMEEYRDLELTLVALMTVLDEPEFVATPAGIVLQAYLPDAHDAAARLARWACARRAADPTAGRLRIRVVKGANLAMEHVDAELHGWIPAPYPTKADVDASYKRLLDTLLDPALADAVDIGVASHNLFDVAWAMLAVREHGAGGRAAFEMLEGMAPAQARAVHERVDAVRMYSPVVADEDFVAAIAYLSRRLDENTQPQNFLRALFELSSGSATFDEQASAFRESVAARHTVSINRRRWAQPTTAGVFANEPESDFTDPQVRARFVRDLDMPLPPDPPRVRSVDEIDEIIGAVAATVDEHPSADRRRAWLLDTAAVMRDERSAIVAAMARETGKTVREGDPEVSEAIDFCEYYGGDGIDRLEAAEHAGLGVRARGVVCVIAPWNFPYAIPVGGVAAALAAGNSVILKPAPEAVRVGALIAEHFWRGGVPGDRLRLVVCADGEVGQRLVTHPLIDTVVLTGSMATASMFLDWQPHRRVLAETSGKNAIVVTETADLDDAIADLVRSAFGHAGQKCSAASLAIVEAPVYDSPAFLPRLREAVSSLRVGPATDVATMVGPVISQPGGVLHRALTSLDAGESWLVEPRSLDADGPLADRVWTPGVRVGVRPGSWFHLTECFGPVLGVMRATDLDHAIDLQNATPFGLTGGIHALDPIEIEHWLSRVEVGNAYVNRVTTGAVVRRQPFGGWKQSRAGGGAKAGGPGYVLQFARLRDHEHERGQRLARAERSYRAAWGAEFSRAHDPSALRAESNILRYVPLGTVAVRHDGTDPSSMDLIRLAAEVAGVGLIESDSRAEDDERFASRTRHVDRVRALTPLADDARRIFHRHNVAVDDDPPVAVGNVELRRWVKEQAISRTLHRHGRLPST